MFSRHEKIINVVKIAMNKGGRKYKNIKYH